MARNPAAAAFRAGQRTQGVITPPVWRHNLTRIRVCAKTAEFMWLLDDLDYSKKYGFWLLVANPGAHAGTHVGVCAIVRFNVQ